MVFESRTGVMRVVVVGTRAKLKAFDVVLTTALGSTLATVLLAKDVALADGVPGLALLIVVQVVVAWPVSRGTITVVPPTPRLRPS